MSLRRVLLAGLAVATLAACGDDDDAAPDSTSPVTTAPVTVTTEAPPDTTMAPDTTAAPTTQPPPTTPPSTASPEEALRAQIAEDYAGSVDRYFELVNEPSLDDLAERATFAAAEGSAYHAAVVGQVENLVALGDRVVPNEPDIRTVTVESVELVGSAPHEEALVTVCAVTNAKQITPAENSPNGQETLTAGTGVLTAVRRQEPVVSTTNGWLPSEATVVAVGVWEGAEQCEPA